MMFYWLCSSGAAGLYVLKIILSFSGAGLYGLPLFVVCIGYSDKNAVRQNNKKRNFYKEVPFVYPDPHLNY